MSHSSVEQQIEAFMSRTAFEYAFPAGLTVEERKAVKSAAEKFGLSSRSFGMGSERQIHIFKPASSMAATLEPVKYSVRNTFIDGPLDTAELEKAQLDPAHQSMPAGSLREHIAAEDESFAVAAIAKVDDSAHNSEVDTSSTKDSDSDPLDSAISVKNTFVHFEENADPRIVQSMPGSTFAVHIEEEIACQYLASTLRAAADKAGSQKRRPLPLSGESAYEASSAMLFPSTPNAETQMDFGAVHGEAISMAQWIPQAMATPASAVTALAPAIWSPSAPGPAVLPPAVWTPSASANENFLTAVPVSHGPQQAPLQAQEVPQAPPQAAPQQPPQALHTLQAPPQAPPQLPPQVSTPPMPPPTHFVPGTPVVLQGLLSQANFNGLPGVVSSFDADCGRYNVMVEVAPNTSRRLVKVKSHNLAAQQFAAPQPQCCPHQQQSVVVSHPSKASLVLDQMV